MDHFHIGFRGRLYVNFGQQYCQCSTAHHYGSFPGAHEKNRMGGDGLSADGFFTAASFWEVERYPWEALGLLSGFFHICRWFVFLRCRRKRANVDHSQGFSGNWAAMLMACSPAIVVDIFPVSERGKALGILGTVVAAGLTAGPALGGYLIKNFSWSAIFYINIPIGIMAGLIAGVVLKGGYGDISRDEKFDWKGAVLLTLTLFSFVLVFAKGFDWGYGSMLTLAAGVFCIICAITLVLVEFQCQYPVFDPALLKNRQFALSVLSALILFASLFTIIFLMPFYLVNPGKLPVDQAGYLMTMPFLCLFFLSPLSGWLSDRIGTRILCTAGMAVLTASLFFMSQLTASASLFSISWRLVLSGVGTAVFLPPNSSLVMSILPINRRGVASGTVATARNIGMVLGVAQAGLIFNKVFSLKSGGEVFKVYVQEIEPFFMAAFQHSMLAGAVISAIGVIVTVMRGPDKK